MAIDKKIISEIQRNHFINNYLNEQEIPPPPAPGGEPITPAPELGEPAPPADTTPEVIDVEKDSEVEKISDSGESEESTSDGGTEELEITDLVKSQENIETKQEEYFNNLFSQISNLESKLGEMDSILNKLNSLENKIEKYREKNPEEKFELRTYDSYPFNQKLSQFFDDKKVEMEKSGKNEYVFAFYYVTNINSNWIKDYFFPNR